MTDEERSQRLARLKALSDRIAILLLRQAQLGPGFPSGQELELREAQQGAQTLMHELGLDTALPEHNGATTLPERVLALEYRIKSLETVVGDALTAINRQLAEIRDSARDWRQAEQQARLERQQLVDARFIRIELAIGGFALALAALVGYLVTK